MKKKPEPDPVTHYATEVVALRIVACRLVRLACQRHLNDLRDAAAKGFVWNLKDANEAINFFSTILCLPEETDADEDVEPVDDVRPEHGTPFHLAPFQQFIVGSLFGWRAYVASKKNPAIRRLQQRFRICYFEGAKGCGKTPMGAGILLFMLIRHGVRGAQLFCAAVTKDQAKLAFADCVKMVEASPALQALITRTGNNLAVKTTGSFIRPISAEKRGLDGKRVQGGVVDELHEHPSATVVVKLIAGIKGRPDALIFIPTNSGFDRESVCWDYHEYSRQILEGTLANETWFAFVCHLDPCAAHLAKGKVQPVADCPDCDDWKVEGPHWLKACPNLGVSVTWQYQREQVRIALHITSQRNWVLRLNFCFWTEGATVWITTEQWDACATPARAAFLASLAGRECFLGIDLSDKIDLSAVVCIFPRPLIGEVAREVETTAARAADLDQPTIDCAIDVLPFFWMPAKTLERRALEDHLPYLEQAKDGHLTTTPGSLIDHDAIADFIVGPLAKLYRIRGIGIDQAGAAGVVSKLKRHFGDEFVDEVPQGFRSLTEASKRMEALVLTGNVAHDTNPVMGTHMGNMGKEENTWREIRPVKLNQRKRMDGGVALIDAIWKMTKTPAAERSVYLTRGVRTLGE